MCFKKSLRDYKRTYLHEQIHLKISFDKNRSHLHFAKSSKILYHNKGKGYICGMTIIHFRNECWIYLIIVDLRLFLRRFINGNLIWDEYCFLYLWELQIYLNRGVFGESIRFFSVFTVPWQGIVLEWKHFLNLSTKGSLKLSLLRMPRNRFWVNKLSFDDEKHDNENKAKDETKIQLLYSCEW